MKDGGLELSRRATKYTFALHGTNVDCASVDAIACLLAGKESGVGGGLGLGLAFDFHKPLVIEIPLVCRDLFVLGD